jgi:hypothetical protein
VRVTIVAASPVPPPDHDVDATTPGSPRGRHTSPRAFLGMKFAGYFDSDCMAIRFDGLQHKVIVFEGDSSFLK